MLLRKQQGAFWPQEQKADLRINLSPKKKKTAGTVVGVTSPAVPMDGT